MEISLDAWDGLGPLWGAIQAEFLTHRKVTDLDPALLTRFDLDSLLQGLRAGRGPTSIDFIEKDLMAKVDNRGWFKDSESTRCPVVNEACKEYFDNIGQWGRIEFLGMPCGFLD